MFILSEESSTKQIFQQTLSLVTTKFCILHCQTTKEKKYLLQCFTDAINYRNYEKCKKISKTTILVAFSSDFMKRGTKLFILYNQQ